MKTEFDKIREIKNKKVVQNRLTAIKLFLENFSKNNRCGLCSKFNQKGYLMTGTNIISVDTEIKEQGNITTSKTFVFHFDGDEIIGTQIIDSCNSKLIN